MKGMAKVVEQEYISTVKEREAIYTFLKIVFEAPITTKTLKHWKENFSNQFIDVLSLGNEKLYRFLKDLKSQDLEVIEKKEKEAYLATFSVFNEYGHIPAPPWESVYVTKDRTMFGRPVFQMREQLDRFGLSVVNKHKEPEDHIAIELEFMCYLIQYTREAFELGDNKKYLKGIYTQYWLHKEHFCRWIKPFTKDLITSNTSDFYKGVGILLHSFLKEDYEYIKTIKEALEK